MPSATAQRPGDVVESYGGKTIEILNTDAEGRLVLADALGYAAQYNPKAAIDLATLTGAVITALGTVACGMMGTDNSLMAKVRSAADRKRMNGCGNFPLWDDYDELIKSDVADVKNIGDSTAGTIVGGAFLKKFAEGYPWVHLDIAGTAWDVKGSSYIPSKGGHRLRCAVAGAVRTRLDFLTTLSIHITPVGRASLITFQFDRPDNRDRTCPTLTASAINS